MNLVALREVATISRSSIKPEEIPTGTIYVGLEHITEEGGFAGVSTVANGELASNKFRFDERHILYGKLRPYLRKIALPSFSGICSTDILPVLPGPHVNRSYLYHYLRTSVMVELATSRSAGANLPRLSPGQLESFEIPLPPLPEQRRIAAILDAADALRAKRRAALGKLDGLLRGVFLEMFGEVGGKGWLTSPLSTCFARDREGTKCGPFGSALKREEYIETGIPVWTMENIQGIRFEPQNTLFISEQKYEQLAGYRVVDGDIIISRAGTVGKMCVVETNEPKSILSTNLIRLSLDNRVLDPYYFVSLMSFGKARVGRLQTGADGAYTFMNTGILKKLQVPIPPIELQRRYQQFWCEREGQAAKMKDSLQVIEKLFVSLQQGAFRGEL